jgi:hypothetical protein
MTGRRAYGSNSGLLFGFEEEYGKELAATAPVYKIPFMSSSVDSAQGLLESNVLGQGREKGQPFLDVINVDGDVVIPMDIRNIGLWLKALLGAPETTGAAGSYTHIFKSGAMDIPSFMLETQMPDAGKFFRVMGARAGSIALNFQRSGEATATINASSVRERKRRIKVLLYHQSSKRSISRVFRSFRDRLNPMANFWPMSQDRR